MCAVAVLEPAYGSCIGTYSMKSIAGGLFASKFKDTFKFIFDIRFMYIL